MNDAGRIGFVIRGDYDSTSTYDFLDVVYYNGSSYVAKKNTIGNEPNRDNDFWHIFAEGADEGDYVLKSDYATTERAGVVKPDGTTITVSEDGTITGSNQTVVDAELSKDSENPVQNKVIAGEIESILSNKQDLLSKRHANSVSNDLNLIKESGIYVIGSTSEYTNLPPELSSDGYCALVVFNSGIYIVQEIFMPFDTKGNIYYRFRTEREDGWKSWKTFGEIYDGYDETRKGFAADATQLNKEVEGSYAAGVAEEISGINADLANITNAEIKYLDVQKKITAVINNKICSLYINGYGSETGANFGKIDSLFAPTKDIYVPVTIVGYGSAVFRISTDGNLYLYNDDCSIYLDQKEIYGVVTYLIS